MATLSTITLRAYDLGLFETLGAELYAYDVDGETRQVYARSFQGVVTNIPGLGGRVPYFFALPEDVYQAFVLPCVILRRTSLTPAFERSPWYGYERAPDLAANPIVITKPDGSTVTGYDRYAEKVVSTPMNIGYDVQIMARTQNDFLNIFQALMMIMRPPFFTFGAIDSAGELRLYDAGAVAISEGSEITAIVDRTISSTVSFEVQGEIDFRAEDNTVPPLADLPNIGMHIYREE
jgi:hypothetical protein